MTIHNPWQRFLPETEIRECDICDEHIVIVLKKMTYAVSVETVGLSSFPDHAFEFYATRDPKKPKWVYYTNVTLQGTDSYTVALSKHLINNDISKIDLSYFKILLRNLETGEEICLL